MSLPPPIRKEAHPFKEKPLRSQGHIKWVEGRHCLVGGCRRTPTHAHHVRLGSHAGMKIKPGDDRVVSLCMEHHSELHTRGEITFQVKHRLNLQVEALAFAAASPVLRRRRQRERTRGV